MPKISGIYEKTLNVHSGPIEDVMNAIQKRHHIIHRNGKDKDGKLIILEKSDVEKLIGDITEFVNNIENQLRQINDSMK